MPKPLTLSVPHSLGRAEAKRRLVDGMGDARARLSAVATSIDDHWTDDRLDFRVVALAQTVSGHIDVLEDRVEVEVELPWALGMLADRLKTKLTKQGTLMLEKK
ncbi:polyhydroxyalkanoic acid system family protein [Azospirillum doebereinerae]|uniref:Polyhydroxyalkanoic acid synthase n=1 Tax=Azospirillum doebereinerae TaxID=92933 RepID=A0A3S1CIK3_9PROT|nr:polyhydroxyalkanoic acid system family protein [Azospirillum doebereinerae]MCG5242037.1 polyhydroxyalkanoic acid system family protein [Azospirillum doebereinerae]RUQ74255.1 polyhydroxyalkanoic acid synthase [Azospirillum doebereinerae]